MSLARVRPAEWLAALAALVLLVSLALPWYAMYPRGGWTSYAPGGGLASPTGWQAFSVIDVLLALLALVGLALLVVQATRRSPALPAAMSVLCVTAGLAAVGLVLARLIDEPDTAVVVLRPAVGAWLGLAGAAGLLAGGWWSMATERTPGVPMPPVELRPAPPAGG